MEVACLVQGPGPGRREVARLEGGHLLLKEEGGVERRLAWAEVARREGSSLVAWPRRSGRRTRLTLTQEGGGRELEGWMEQQAGGEDGRQLLVFVNPYSGTGRAEARWEEVMELAGLRKEQVRLVTTEHAGHARELLATMELGQYRAVVSNLHRHPC
jgi:hypothetical protein